MRCPTCKSEKFTAATAMVPWAFDGFNVDVVLPCQRCAQCGEEIISGSDSERAERAVAFALAQHAPVSGGAFRHMRKVLGISRAEMATFAGVDPATITRWEKQERATDRAAWELVATIVAEVGVDSIDDVKSKTLERLRLRLMGDKLNESVRPKHHKLDLETGLLAS